MRGQRGSKRHYGESAPIALCSLGNFVVKSQLWQVELGPGVLLLMQCVQLHIYHMDLPFPFYEFILTDLEK